MSVGVNDLVKEYEERFNKKFSEEFLEFIDLALDSNENFYKYGENNTETEEYEYESSVRKVGDLQYEYEIEIINTKNREETINMVWDNGINNGTELRNYSIYTRELSKEEKQIFKNEELKRLKNLNKIQIKETDLSINIKNIKGS